MKHVFSIHSPITYFCSVCVILHEQLHKDDVIFLYTSYKPETPYGSVVPSYAQQHKSLWSKLWSFNLTKAYDHYLSKFLNDDTFIAYIDLAHYYQKILITHQQCEAFHFIEEGTASYIEAQSLKDVTRIESKMQFRNVHLKEYMCTVVRVLRGYNLKLLALPYFANAYAFISDAKFYGFDASIFPGVSPDKIIKLEPLQYHLEPSAIDNGLHLSNSIILIEESYFKGYGLHPEAIATCFKRSLLKLKALTHEKKILVKLRPNQNKADALWVQYLEKNAIQFEILPSALVLEMALLKSHSCIVIGTVSSLLFYAAIFGHQSLSNYQLIDHKPVSVFDQFHFYWNRVEGL